MTSTATARPSPHTPWTSSTGRRSYHKSSTTPLGIPSTFSPASVGQPMPPNLSTKVRSPGPHKQNDPRTPSPNYFGFVVEGTNNNPIDSNAGAYAKKNWSPPSPSIRTAAVTSPKILPLDANPEFEAFRRQSESNQFKLGHGNLSHFSSQGSGKLPTLGSLAAANDVAQAGEALRSPRLAALAGAERSIPRSPKDTADSSQIDDPRRNSENKDAPSFFDLPRTESPANMSSFRPPPISQRSHLSHIDDRFPRLSLPGTRAGPPSPASSTPPKQRSETLPSTLNPEGPIMITAQNYVDLLQNYPFEETLLLDLRVSPQFVQCRIEGALNLCIPTTLLKRPSYTVQKLSETFKKEQEKEKFAQWKDVKYIVVYDASSAQLKDATSSINTLKKFVNEGWHGTAYIIRGGFNEFSKKFPDFLDRQSNIQNEVTVSTGTMPVVGGCPMPATQNAANPFFGNIRQNMDLIGGVGQMSIKHPAALSEKNMMDLPKWIREASDCENEGKTVAARFLSIEKDEQERMQKALSGKVQYGTPDPNMPQTVQIAGIEKGVKNRYKDMLPYDHSRVKLQNVPVGECDYVNASHIKAEWSNRHYIASQAPVPATFEDFWRVVWEQDTRVIVMLTAEMEGNTRKCHPYWIPNDYGPLKVKALSEKRVPLESPLKSPSSNLASPPERPGLGKRRATQSSGVSSKNVSQESVTLPGPEIPYVIIRKMALTHSGHPFKALREITQLQYSNWPDFGAPTHPAHVLSLVEHCGSVMRSYAMYALDPNSPAKEDEKPIMVHCSAGCGRTGTFCTIDSVVDMLKRQKKARITQNRDAMDLDGEEWVKRDDLDLITKTVADFRLQRLSMVQTLRQFVLCYETVLEWLVREIPDRTKDVRRSYHG